MSNEKPLTLKTILDNLKAIANEVRSDSSFCKDIKQELEEYGYDWFGVSSSLEGEDLKEQVMKVLAVAVNEAIRTKVDLSGENKEAVKAELHQLLDDNKYKPSVDHFKVSLSNGLASMSSPLDMAKHLKKKEGIQWLVVNIIQYQFEMKWNTDTPAGEPDDYTFYEFCDKGNTTEFFKYKPRQAHVKATLYKECRRKSVNYLRGITKENLCPTVYIRAAGEWVSWRADGNYDGIRRAISIDEGDTDLNWITPSIRNFIKENADEQRVDHEDLKCLAKPTLYWAVLDDRDFQSEVSLLKVKRIGKTQVYVGKANNGIRGRWLKDSDSHCEMMKKCLDNVCAMTTYDSLRLEGIQLVDARLTLAKIREERTALFVIKTFGDNVEKAEIAVEKARMRLDEAKESLQLHMPPLTPQTIPRQPTLETVSSTFNMTHLRPALPTNSTPDQLRDEVAKRQEELDQAIVDIEDSKNLKRSKSEAEALLSEAERLHRKGKRVNDSRKNIIPFEDCRMTWTPKNMRYGMNNK